MTDGYTPKYDTTDMQEMVGDGMAKAGIISIEYIPIYIIVLLLGVFIYWIISVMNLTRKK